MVTCGGINCGCHKRHTLCTHVTGVRRVQGLPCPEFVHVGAQTVDGPVALISKCMRAPTHPEPDKSAHPERGSALSSRSRRTASSLCRRTVTRRRDGQVRPHAKTRSREDGQGQGQFSRRDAEAHRQVSARSSVIGLRDT